MALVVLAFPRVTLSSITEVGEGSFEFKLLSRAKECDLFVTDLTAICFNPACFFALFESPVTFFRFPKTDDLDLVSPPSLVFNLVSDSGEADSCDLALDLLECLPHEVRVQVVRSSDQHHLSSDDLSECNLGLQAPLESPTIGDPGC